MTLLEIYNRYRKHKLQEENERVAYSDALLDLKDNITGFVESYGGKVYGIEIKDGGISILILQKMPLEFFNKLGLEMGMNKVFLESKSKMIEVTIKICEN